MQAPTINIPPEKTMHGQKIFAVNLLKKKIAYEGAGHSQ